MEEESCGPPRHGDDGSPIALLPDPLILRIMSGLSSADLAAAACVQRSWRSLASDGSLWQQLLSSDWPLPSHLPQCDPTQTSRRIAPSCAPSSSSSNHPAQSPASPTPRSKAAYMHHVGSYRRYGTLYLRALACWQGITDWLAKNHADVAATLLPGASEQELDEVEAKLGLKLPPAMRAVYRVCAGQKIPDRFLIHRLSHADDRMRPILAAHPSLHLGLLGGYSAYDHLLTTFLLPLDILVVLNQGMRTKPHGALLIACASAFAKSFFLSCSSGLVFCADRSRDEHMRCVPERAEQGAVMATQQQMSSFVSRLPAPGPVSAGAAEAADGVLRWLEEYSRRLRSGWYKTRMLLDKLPCRAISLFPEVAPLCSRAVTRGVQVRASAVMLPELSLVGEDGRHSLSFAYSIRMRLLSEEEQEEEWLKTRRREGSGEGNDEEERASTGRSGGDGGMRVGNGNRFQLCQLRSRHWVIREMDVVDAEVRGEAVIGMFPILKRGDEEFVYQSCSQLMSERGSIEGDFTFVPGTLQEPQGAEFEVQVGRFPLQMPSYIF